MSHALEYAVSVTGLLLSLLAGVVWLYATPSSLAPRRWLTAVLVLYLAFSVHAIGRITSWPLRRGFYLFSAADVPPGRSAIVLLSAGSRTVHGPGTDKISVLNLAAAARVIEAARVFRTMDSPWIVSSGGAAAGRDMTPESETMKTALIQLGVPADRILILSSNVSGARVRRLGYWSSPRPARRSRLALRHALVPSAEALADGGAGHLSGM